ncbi:MAG: ABC transporter permease subunit, partial [Synergistales bacterium]|nr:ABC transporter permease subunit [Synergistales bacterium]MDD5514719.1 ABC transporter permease subunit [Synergistales bacterium]
MFPEAFKYSVAKSVNSAIKWLLNTHGSAFDSFSSGILSLLLWVQGILVSIPWWAYIAFIALMAWIATRKIIPVIVLAVLPIFIGMFGLWHLALETLALVITSVVIALAIGIPMGVLMAEARYFAEFIKPVLDAMQTMPSFVYLIPAMMLFGLGKVPAVIATLIYALPPVMRLTCLGLQQVPRPVQEAALAYGATRWQLLKEVRIPLAMPSILAGVNQTTMMALAMVVIASMIGARGLGQEVLMAINRIDVGRGFEAGISIVIMGIVIDRITQGLAKRWDPNR